jgi:hypothetical protein
MRSAPRCSTTNNRKSAGGEVASIAPPTTEPTLRIVTVLPATGVSHFGSPAGSSLLPPQATRRQISSDRRIAAL